MRHASATALATRRESHARPPRRLLARLLRRLLMAVAYILVAAFVTVFALSAAGIVRFVPVLSNSMAPGMPTGSLAITLPIERGDVRADDVIVFTAPDRAALRVIHRVTHVYGIDEAADFSNWRPDRLFMATKGDNNPAADPWVVSVSDSTLWRRLTSVPYLGQPAIWSADPRARVAAFVLAGVALTTWALVALWRRPATVDDDEADNTEEHLVTRASPLRRVLSRPPTMVWAIGLVLTAAVVGGAPLVGANALFRDVGKAEVSIGAGAVTLDWDATGTNQLTLAVGPLRPADSLERIGDLKNTGSVGIGDLQLAATGTNTGTVSDGVQLRIDRCSARWAASGGAYACPGTVTLVSPDRPLTGIASLAGSPALATGGTDHLRFTFRLPDSSPSTDENAAGSVLLVATGNQGPGRQR